MTDLTKDHGFKREWRYVVFKMKDLHKYCTPSQLSWINDIGDCIASGRYADGKPPFNAVVVEEDWPEFEPTWAAIEARMSGFEAPPQGRPKLTDEFCGKHLETLATKHPSLLVRQLAQRLIDVRTTELHERIAELEAENARLRINDTQQVPTQEPVAWMHRVTGIIFHSCPIDAEQDEFIPLIAAAAPPDAAAQIAELEKSEHEWRQKAKDYEQYAGQLLDRFQELEAAARALIERWDTPLWKDAPATAKCINSLCAAIGEKE